jgi:cyanophycinase
MTTGYILLEGGAEFGGAMSEPDREAIRLAGGTAVPMAILPTAAAPDGNQDRAGRNGLDWFRSLGASSVDIVPILDRTSANDPALAERLGRARLIYMLGGFPRHLAETLRGSLTWEAALRAHAAGAVLGGSSAGAMVVCEHYYDPDSGQVRPGLNLLGGVCVLPHHNGFGRGWSSQLIQALPGATLIGIDEATGIIGAQRDSWAVYGSGQVTLYQGGSSSIHVRGASFGLG